MYSSTHSLTSALMEVSDQLHGPAALPPGRLGGTQSRSGRGGEEKNSQLPPGIEP
jgi:hypothetical protein